MVQVGDAIHVRSVNGPGSDWDRGTGARQEGRIQAGGVGKDVTIIDADDEVNDAVDTAHRTKHGHYAAYIIKAITSPEASSTTTYSPLRRFGAGPGKKVAVVGLGGLGHMAVKLAHAMGTVLSQSLKKMDDGPRLGAEHCHATSDPAPFGQLVGTFDLIVNTVSAKLDLDAYVGLLAVNGTMVNVGAPAEPLSLNVFSLIMQGRSYAGSLIGGIPQPRRCSTSAPSTASVPRSRSSRPRRSTRRTSGSSPPTCATAS